MYLRVCLEKRGERETSFLPSAAARLCGTRQSSFVQDQWFCLGILVYFTTKRAAVLVWESSVDPDQSDQVLHCLRFHLQLLDPLHCSKTTLFQF